MRDANAIPPCLQMARHTSTQSDKGTHVTLFLAHPSLCPLKQAPTDKCLAQPIGNKETKKSGSANMPYNAAIPFCNINGAPNLA
jgi:hypothetical protein